MHAIRSIYAGGFSLALAFGATGLAGLSGCGGSTADGTQIVADESETKEMTDATNEFYKNQKPTNNRAREY